MASCILRLAATPLIGPEIVADGIADGVGAIMGCGIAGRLTRLAGEEGTGLLLSLHERQDGQAVRVACIVGGADRLIVPPSRFVAKLADPSAAVSAAAVAERATFRNDCPIGLASGGELGAGGPGVELRIADCAGHAKSPLPCRTANVRHGCSRTTANKQGQEMPNSSGFVELLSFAIVRKIGRFAPLTA